VEHPEDFYGGVQDAAYGEDPALYGQETVEHPEDFYGGVQDAAYGENPIDDSQETGSVCSEFTQKSISSALTHKSASSAFTALTHKTASSMYTEVEADLQSKIYPQFVTKGNQNTLSGRSCTSASILESLEALNDDDGISISTAKITKNLTHVGILDIMTSKNDDDDISISTAKVTKSIVSRKPITIQQSLPSQSTEFKGPLGGGKAEPVGSVLGFMRPKAGTTDKAHNLTDENNKSTSVPSAESTSNILTNTKPQVIPSILKNPINPMTSSSKDLANASNNSTLGSSSTDVKPPDNPTNAVKPSDPAVNGTKPSNAVMSANRSSVAVPTGVNSMGTTAPGPGASDAQLVSYMTVLVKLLDETQEQLSGAIERSESFKMLFHEAAQKVEELLVENVRLKRDLHSISTGLTPKKPSSSPGRGNVCKDNSLRLSWADERGLHSKSEARPKCPVGKKGTAPRPPQQTPESPVVLSRSRQRSAATRVYKPELRKTVPMQSVMGRSEQKGDVQSEYEAELVELESQAEVSSIGVPESVKAAFIDEADNAYDFAAENTDGDPDSSSVKDGHGPVAHSTANVAVVSASEVMDTDILKSARKLLQSEKRCLQAIFDAYFPAAPSRLELGKVASGRLLTTSSVITFAKDFDIVPQIVTLELCTDLIRSAIAQSGDKCDLSACGRFGVYEDSWQPQTMPLVGFKMDGEAALQPDIVTFSQFQEFLLFIAISCEWFQTRLDLGTPEEQLLALLRWMDSSHGRERLAQRSRGSVAVPVFRTLSITSKTASVGDVLVHRSRGRVGVLSPAIKRK